MPWEDWAQVREDLRGSSIPLKPLTPEEEALRDRREAQFLKATVVVLILLSLWVLWYFVFPHLGTVANFIALFSQNPVLAGVTNILSCLASLIGVLVLAKAYVNKKKAMKKPEK